MLSDIYYGITKISILSLSQMKVNWISVTVTINWNNTVSRQSFCTAFGLV